MRNTTVALAACGGLLFSAGAAEATGAPNRPAPGRAHVADDGRHGHVAARDEDPSSTIDNATGGCIDYDLNGDQGFSVDLGQDCDHDSGQWTIHDLGNKYVRFQIYGSPDTCLGMNPANGVVGAWNCDDTTSVWWVDHRSSTDRPKLWNQYAKHHQWDAQCLDVPGDQTYLHVNPCNDGPYQQWHFWDVTQ